MDSAHSSGIPSPQRSPLDAAAHAASLLGFSRSFDMLWLVSGSVASRGLRTARRFHAAQLRRFTRDLETDGFPGTVLVLGDRAAAVVTSRVQTHSRRRGGHYLVCRYQCDAEHVVLVARVLDPEGVLYVEPEA